MKVEVIYRLIISGVILVAGFVLRGLIGASINRKVRAKTLKPQSGLLTRKLATAFILIGVVLAVGLAWGVAPKTIWVSLASVITLVILGFFAVWCILSNIVAGLILVISRPFDIDDEIILVPENLQGTVRNITVMFLILEDSEGNTISIPNNLIFQRMVKKLEKKSTE
jgi:small-conductance mechanosensitive channel